MRWYEVRKKLFRGLDSTAGKTKFCVPYSREQFISMVRIIDLADAESRLQMSRPVLNGKDEYLSLIVDSIDDLEVMLAFHTLDPKTGGDTARILSTEGTTAAYFRLELKLVTTVRTGSTILKVIGEYATIAAGSVELPPERQVDQSEKSENLLVRLHLRTIPDKLIDTGIQAAKVRARPPSAATPEAANRARPHVGTYVCRAGRAGCGRLRGDGRSARGGGAERRGAGTGGRVGGGR